MYLRPSASEDHSQDKYPKRSHTERLLDAKIHQGLASANYFMCHVYNGVMIACSLGLSTRGQTPWNKELTTDKEKIQAAKEVTTLIYRIICREVIMQELEVLHDPFQNITAGNDGRYALYKELMGVRGSSPDVANVVAEILVDKTTTKKEILNKFVTEMGLEKYYRRKDIDAGSSDTENVRLESDATGLGKYVAMAVSSFLATASAALAVIACHVHQLGIQDMVTYESGMGMAAFCAISTVVATMLISAVKPGHDGIMDSYLVKSEADKYAKLVKDSRVPPADQAPLPAM